MGLKAMNQLRFKTIKSCLIAFALSILNPVSFAMKPYILQYFAPAPESAPRSYPEVIEQSDGTLEFVDAHHHKEDGWESWALPLGNGYFGAKIFGGVPIERIQITENSLANPIKIKPQKRSKH